MYKNLVEVGLTEYLNSCCNSENWIKEGWLVGLDDFVGNLSEKNKKLIKEKIKNASLEEYQINDILNEVMIACAYHPKANFVEENALQKSCDLFDSNSNINIEIKSLNEGDDERKRHTDPGYGSPSVNIAAIPPDSEDMQIKKILEKKCSYHLKKAVEQIGHDNKGSIYLVYDYNFMQHGDTGPYLSPIQKEGTGVIIENYINEFSKKYPNIFFQAIYFEKLREIISTHDQIYPPRR